MIPPFSTPSNASWWASGDQSATTIAASSGLGRLSMRSPCSFAGPHPKQRLRGA